MPAVHPLDSKAACLAWFGLPPLPQPHCRRPILSSKEWGPGPLLGPKFQGDRRSRRFLVFLSEVSLRRWNVNISFCSSVLYTGGCLVPHSCPELASPFFHVCTTPSLSINFSVQLQIHCFAQINIQCWHYYDFRDHHPQLSRMESWDCISFPLQLSVFPGVHSCLSWILPTLPSKIQNQLNRIFPHILGHLTFAPPLVLLL